MMNRKNDSIFNIEAKKVGFATKQADRLPTGPRHRPTLDFETATVPLIGQQTLPPQVPTAYFDLVIDPIAGLNPIMA